MTSERRGWVGPVGNVSPPRRHKFSFSADLNHWTSGDVEEGQGARGGGTGS